MPEDALYPGKCIKLSLKHHKVGVYVVKNWKNLVDIGNSAKGDQSRLTVAERSPIMADFGPWSLHCYQIY